MNPLNPSRAIYLTKVQLMKYSSSLNVQEHDYVDADDKEEKG